MPILFFVAIYIFPYSLMVWFEPGLDKLVLYPLVVLVIYSRVFRFRLYGRAAVVSVFSFRRGFVLASVAGISTAAGIMTVHSVCLGVVAVLMIIALPVVVYILLIGPEYGWDA